MGMWDRIAGLARDAGQIFRRSDDSSIDAMLWGQNLYSSPSLTGINVNQQTALMASAVMACVTMLAEDVSKLPCTVIRTKPNGDKEEASNHWLYDLLDQPNDWQNGLEFREQLQLSLIMRGNAYAVIKRNGRGQAVAFIPVNADWVALWEAPDGKLFYRVTATGLHLGAVLSDQPFLIPFEDMFHVRGFSSNGLLGASRIALGREAIALFLAQEQQAARWMGNGAKPSGMFTTDQKLSEDAAARLASRIKSSFTGLQNSGKVIVGEQGLKFEKFDMTSSDLEFIASRKFQLQEIARIFRIPLHMIGDLAGATYNNVGQMGQEYVNLTITGYTNRWRAKYASQFNLKRDALSVEFDYSELTRADFSARTNNWRTMIMSMIAKPDEARADLGLPKEGGEADKLQFPANMEAAGSQSTGTMTDKNAGRPTKEAAAAGGGDKA